MWLKVVISDAQIRRNDGQAAYALWVFQRMVDGIKSALCRTGEIDLLQCQMLYQLM